ncbi:hypothetical protein OUZ56_025402 [Daphnia magna]|uniref:Uncharacterized protein n=1 Tax=Daphnia magna TaxID=35525 RepID=A0ABQ9ZJR5_9CRUS|nr:hypothetical protein OUZ56_025402 [Daphnia magna]
MQNFFSTRLQHLDDGSKPERLLWTHFLRWEEKGGEIETKCVLVAGAPYLIDGVGMCNYYTAGLSFFESPLHFGIPVRLTDLLGIRENLKECNGAHYALLVLFINSQLPNKPSLCPPHTQLYTMNPSTEQPQNNAAKGQRESSGSETWET